MPDSLFDEIMRDSAIPALEAVSGIAAIRIDADAEETALIVMPQTELAPVGEYGERMESRMTLELAKSHGARVGDGFAIAVDPSEDDPDPDPILWRAVQLLADDGYLQKFAVLQETA
jgi:hypothetical protein